jgi:hypothetical protein
MFDFLKNFFNRFKKPISEASYLEDIGWNSISSDKNTQGLGQTSRDAQLKTVFQLWLRDGFAKQLIQLPIDFIIGDEMFIPEFKSKHDTIPETTLNACSELIAEFKEKNKFENKFEKYATDLSLNGMLLLPVIETENGNVTIGFIHPGNIETVVPNPYDVTDIMSVKMKTDFTTKQKVYKIIRIQSAFDEATETNPIDYDLLTGDAFYHSVNNVSNQPEGVSDLLADLDMLQKLDEMIISVADSIKLANMFVFDTEIQGANGDQIKQWKLNNPLPTRPTRFIHNERVKQQLLSTNVRAFTGHEVIRTIKNFILGNFAFPPMWFADGEDANRAIAIEQGTPVYKKLLKRQELLIEIIKNIYMYVIHSAIRSREGFPLKREDLENFIIQIKAPEIQIRNLERITNSLNTLTTSLNTAEQNNWLSSETVRKSFIQFVNLLGFDIDFETENTAVETQKEEEEIEQQNNPNNPDDPNNQENNNEQEENNQEAA